MRPTPKEFLGVGNPAADYLATLDDVIYADNLGFSEHIPTREAWAALFNLGQKSRDRGSFSGSTPSLLTVLLRENNYTITTGFSGDYFGWQQGEFVDNYFRGEVARLVRDLSCTTAKGGLGFCSKFSERMYSIIFSKDTYRESRNRSVREWPATVIDLIDRAEQGETGPVFSAFYIYKPIGHTGANYVHDDPEMFEEYRRYFVDAAKRAREVVHEIDRLRRRYPESIFIISGDHGPYLSRSAPEEGEKDRRFIVLDRHGVALALLNASSLCEWSRGWLSRQRYLTPSRMLAASLACNGESRQLVERFTDNEEFIRFGESFAGVGGTDVSRKWNPVDSKAPPT